MPCQHTHSRLGVHFVPFPHFNLTPNCSVCRLPLLLKRKDLWFSSQLACPVVLRKTLCGKVGNVCKCSSQVIPKVTDLEYDHLISNQLSHMDQIIVVCVFSAKKEDKTIKEVTDLYKEINKLRNMPCIQVSVTWTKCGKCLLVCSILIHSLRHIKDYRRTFGSPPLYFGIYNTFVGIKSQVFMAFLWFGYAFSSNKSTRNLKRKGLVGDDYILGPQP